MSLFALVVIAGLVTALLVKCHKTAPALVAGLVTAGLVFATFPALGPAVTSGTAEFAHQLGAATDRAADVPPEVER
ncbi:hypothetical protein PHK61_15205 [Actinomycetospora lutea]|uniref:hypothetical protein n=1 Tax=Actinomycetospora lutea TaxID=663604 RepID=UPI0023667199|nr:hypothetical protein [Actinomycetospora lutea]MDD7939770.1 hypothetical protein [Actinomycetospora lutea]